MKKIYLFLLSLVFWTQMCAGFATALPTQNTSTSPSGFGFEPSTVLDAREILPSELIKSDYHTVLDDVKPFGLFHHFVISSPFGQFDAYGQDMLRIRIQEIRALAKLKEEDLLDRASAFGHGVTHAALSPFKFVINFFSNPVETAIGIPKGLWRATTRLKEMALGDRGRLEDPISEELIGFSIVKRQIADQLGVDAYSSNPVLQKTLDRLSWAGYAGDTGVRLLTIPVGGPAGAVLTGTTLSTTVSDLLRDYAPEDLRRLNREKLEAMGVEEQIIEAFLHHEWYSPRHETVIVQALTEMQSVPHRGRFLKAALSAQFEEDALYFQRTSEMLVAYHLGIRPLGDIITLDDRFVFGYTANHTKVAMIPLARLSWHKEVAHMIGRIRQWKNSAHPTQPLEIWIAGEPTPTAAKHLKDLGLTVHSHARHQLRWAAMTGHADSSMTAFR